MVSYIEALYIVTIIIEEEEFDLDSKDNQIYSVFRQCYAKAIRDTILTERYHQ